MGTKELKVLCYTDTSDNTKGLLLAVGAEVDFSKCGLDEKAKWQETIERILEKAFEVEFNDSPEDVWEVANALVHGNVGYLTDYEFYFENVVLIEP